MDNYHKYLYIKKGDKNVYEIVDELMRKNKSPLIAIKRLKEIFPALSLMEAKGIVIIRTSEHKSLYDYQGSLFSDLEEFDRLMNEEKENRNE
ncbi:MULTISPECIES: hypothetical protein [unclassified Chryseobacterium]|uniref:hypothetical protein n=1 Tax=unclassified Chryseobacterium TaxID=2593645 RepID=UPI00226A4D54|nr:MULTISPECIES: hypothetical protein [unclassified Chryseobacterium]